MNVQGPFPLPAVAPMQAPMSPEMQKVVNLLAVVETQRNALVAQLSTTQADAIGKDQIIKGLREEMTRLIERLTSAEAEISRLTAEKAENPFEPIRNFPDTNDANGQAAH